MQIHRKRITRIDNYAVIWACMLVCRVPYIEASTIYAAVMLSPCLKNVYIHEGFLSAGLNLQRILYYINIFETGGVFLKELDVVCDVADGDMDKTYLFI